MLFFFLQLFKNVHTARCLHFVFFNVVEATHASCMYVTVIHWNTILLPVQLQCTRMNMFAEQVKPVNGESHGWTPKVKYWIPRKKLFYFIYKESSNYWSLGFHFCPRCFCCRLKWRRGSSQQNLLIIYWRNTHFSAKMELVAHVFYKFMCNLTSLVLRWMFPCEAECISGAVLSAQLG